LVLLRPSWLNHTGWLSHNLLVRHLSFGTSTGQLRIIRQSQIKLRGIQLDYICCHTQFLSAQLSLFNLFAGLDVRRLAQIHACALVRGRGSKLSKGYLHNLLLLLLTLHGEAALRHSVASWIAARIA